MADDRAGGSPGTADDDHGDGRLSARRRVGGRDAALEWARKRAEAKVAAEAAKEERRKAAEAAAADAAEREAQLAALREVGHAGVFVPLEPAPAARKAKPASNEPAVEEIVVAAPATKGSRAVSEVERIRANREARRQRAKDAAAARDAELANCGDVSSWPFVRLIKQYQAHELLGLQAKAREHGMPDLSTCRTSVLLRIRPLNSAERKDTTVFNAVTSVPPCTVVVHEPKRKVDLTPSLENHEFEFDRVFDETADNSTVYESGLKSFIARAAAGSTFTCFAYGQTGSGKTYTMSALIKYAVQDLFNSLVSRPDMYITVSYFEIYMAKVFDLFARRQQLPVREDDNANVHVVGLKDVTAGNADELIAAVEVGNEARRTGSTDCNADSSRSHAVLKITLRTQAHPGSNRGQVCLVDLAGSERAADVKNIDKVTRLEGAEINKSLLALKECIRAMDQESQHTPFRGSKLTQILRDSLIGRNTQTVMIATVSPASPSADHTLNTLRYASRLKDTTSRGQPPPAVIAPSNAAGAPAAAPAGLWRKQAPSPVDLNIPAHIPTAPVLSPKASPTAAVPAPAPVPPAQAQPAAGRPPAHAPAGGKAAKLRAQAVVSPSLSPGPAAESEPYYDGSPRRNPAAAPASRVAPPPPASEAPEEAQKAPKRMARRYRSEQPAPTAMEPSVSAPAPAPAPASAATKVSPILSLLNEHATFVTASERTMSELHSLLVATAGQEQQRLRDLQRGSHPEADWAHDRLMYARQVLALVEEQQAKLQSLRVAAHGVVQSAGLDKSGGRIIPASR